MIRYAIPKPEPLVTELSNFVAAVRGEPEGRRLQEEVIAAHEVGQVGDGGLVGVVGGMPVEAPVSNLPGDRGPWEDSSRSRSRRSTFSASLSFGIAPLYRNGLSRLFHLPHFRLRNPIGPNTSIGTCANSIAEKLAFVLLLFKIEPQSCTIFQVRFCCK